MKCIRKARRGSEDTFGRLAAECQGYLVSVARNKLPQALSSKLDASDIVQETLLKAFRNFHRFPGTTRKDAIRWLRRILINHLVDVVRHHGLVGEVPLREWSVERPMPRGRSGAESAAIGPGPESLVSLREQTVRLQHAMDMLPDDYRRVVLLRNRDRLPFGEIGRRMGRSAGAVRKLWTRALSRLQADLEGPRQNS
jgi:RNA polymerase sigma-70 factor (ECF subfamily)